MKKKKVTVFPKGFFQKKRPTISASEALKDVIPYDWSNETLDVKKKTILYPTKHNN